ncbi:hypothetical protein R84981_002904 [Carnimonas sp. R-84981]|uniref:hypothetical protein n=1 Tax=Carnimonas bestiolae TaxID=3402172 RepID=UPI003EDBF1BB
MRVRNVENGDLVTSGEQFAFGREATGKGIKYRLQMFLGEYILDYSQGTPWFQGVLGKASRDMAEANLKQRIISAPGVVNLTDFSFDFDQSTRRIQIAATVIDENNESVQLSIDQELF